MVGIVIVSHSAKLAAGIVELARSAAGPDVKIAAAGGLNMPDSPLGTDGVFVLHAIEEVYSDDGVLVLMDMGSAILSAELAIDLLPSERRAKVVLCSAPITEGAVTAAIQARLGQTLADVVNEASAALDVKRAQFADTGPSIRDVPAIAPVQNGAEYEICLPVHNLHGLHARPAARLLRTAAQFQAGIQLSNLTNGRGPVSSKSINDVMMLNVLQGHTLKLCASGPQACEALEALQTLAATNFGDEDEALGEIAVKSDIEDATTKPDERTHTKTFVASAMKYLHGIPAFRGIAIGPARLLRVTLPDIPRDCASDPQAEWKRLVEAWDKTQRQIEYEREQVSSRTDQDTAPLFDAHLLLLQDDSLRVSARRAIFDSGHNAALAWHLTVEQAAAEYASLGNEYLRARSADVREIGSRVLLNLLGHAITGVVLNKQGIIITGDIGLGEIAHIDPKMVLGICTRQGGATSHSAILIGNLGIPAVMGLGEQASAIEEDAMVIVDGDKGIVVVEPSTEMLDDYRKRLEALQAVRDQTRRKSLALAFTRDGRRVEVAANIGSTIEAKAAFANGAEGVGLYRTEFLFLARQTAPEEAEQLAAYREAALAIAKRPLIIRTLDIGGDKILPYLRLETEANPFLGLRGLRLSLKHRDLFKTQLRAILRAAAEFPIKIMFPMVTTPAEWREAIKLLSEARSEVEAIGLPLPPRIDTGMMIEIPGAALQVEQFAPVADFFSIGSNDLTQYTLAAERGNPSVATLADGLHPAVLRLIQHVVEVAHFHGKRVGICGEIAGDAVAVPLLVGLGIDELSMNIAGIPLIKQLIRTLDFPIVQALAKTSLALETAEDVRAFMGQ